MNDGEITFGFALVFYFNIATSLNPFLSSGLDDTKFDSNTLVTLPNVNPQGFWEASMDTVTVNDLDMGLIDRTAILDTGRYQIRFHLLVPS